MNEQDNLLEQAVALYRSGDLVGAQHLCARISETDADFPGALHLLSAISLTQGHVDAAVRQCQRAASLEPTNPSILNGLAIALHTAGQFLDASSTIDQAISLSDELPELYANRSMILGDLGKLEEAFTAADEALSIDENCLAALNSKGKLYQKTGRADLAFNYFDKAQALKPNLPKLLYNKLTAINYSPAYTTEDVYRLTGQYWVSGRQSGEHARVDQTRGLKSPTTIGFVSADFRRHAVGFLFKPYFDNRDRDRYKVRLYSNYSAEDDVTAEYKTQCDGWRNIFGMSDRAVADQIVADEVDLLIDLSGLTDGHRLGVFALKPAKVQATWLGYVATTGVPEIDYIICDKFVLPVENEKYFIEKPLRLPECYLPFSPPDLTQRPASSPVIANEHIVFGSFNNLIKVNPDVVEAWATILQQTPGSRLLLKCPQLSDDFIRASILELFAEKGVGRDRLTLMGRTTREEHLEAYSRIDIALDTFPYGGGITTAETLWMGVPVITLAGDNWQSRAGYSILETVGLPQFVSHTVDDYIRKAIDLACDRDNLIAMRRNIRSIVQSSPFCDEKKTARDVEDAFAKMWTAADQS